MLVLNLIQNVALLVTLVVVHPLLARRFRIRYPWFHILSGLLFGGVCVIGMMAPVQIAPGVIFDGRSIVLSVAGLFGGPIVALVAAIVSGSYRLYIGGSGAIPGIVVIVEATTIGLAFNYLGRRDSKFMSLFWFWVLGLVVHAAMIFTLLLMLGDQLGPNPILNLGAPILVLYPIATMVICRILQDYEERLEIEENLKQSQEKYRILVENAAEGIVVVQDAHIVFANAALATIVGYTQDELLVRPFVDFAHPDDRRMLIERHQLRLEGKEFPSIGELRVIHKSGAVRWVELNAVRIEWNSRVAVLNFITDITNRKSAEKALAESGIRYKSVVDALGSAVLVHASDGTIIECNAAAEQVLGISRGQILGSGPQTSEWPAIFEDGSPFPVEEYPVVITQRTGIAQHGVVMGLTRPDGKQIWIIINTVPLSGPNRDKPFAVVSSLVDITELKRLSEALARSNDELEFMIQALPDLLFHMSGDGTIKDFRAQDPATLYLPPDEFIGRKLQDVLPPDAAKAISEGLAELYRGDKIVSVTYKLPMPNGDHWFEARFNTLSSSDEVVALVRNITDRKRVEDALLENQAYLAAFIKHAPAAVAMMDTELRYIACSARWMSDYGIEGRDIVGISHYEVFPEIPARWKEIHRRCLQGSIERCEEDPFARSDGTIQWLSWEVHPWYTIDGRIGGLMMFTQDITQSRQADERLRHERERFAAIIEATNIGTWEWNVQTGDAIFNERWATIGGYTLEELAPHSIQTWIDLAHPDDLAHSIDLISKHFSGEIPYYDCECRMRHKDGSWVWVHDRGKVTEWGSDGSPHVMAGTHTDITGRKQADEALRELTERFKKIAAQVPGVVYQYKLRQDGTSCFPYASEGIRSIYRVDPDDVREDASAVFEVLHPEDYDGIVESIQVSARNMTTWRHEYRVKFPDGDVRWLYGNAIPQVDTDGAVLWHGFISDITEQRRLRDETEALQGQLLQAQKMESVGRLAGGVAHDFNNMLGVILGHTEIALINTRKDNPIHHDLAEIQRAAQRSADLTRQLLAFARRQTVNPQPLDLNETVGGMLKMLGRLTGEAIELLWLPGPSLWRVKIDPSQVDQILTNLIINARDAVKGSGRVSIQTENAHVHESDGSSELQAVPGEYVLLSVSDNGCGMTKEVLAKVFEPFFTTKPVGEGTGLGLSTVYGIVKQNDGFIHVDSEWGGGSVFKIYFPRHTQEVIEDKSIIAARSAKRGTETILLVEDEVSILELSKRILESLGYTVMAASSPGEAIQVCSRFEGVIHLLVTDVVMPEMNGRQLASKLNEMRPGMKCLFMSGYTADVIADHGVLDKDVRFIQKPFSIADLAVKVREAMEE
ncbi:MAG: hypothetical protein AMXMBFR84_39470 [Candidatus Hydrogenedentota bacterium]